MGRKTQKRFILRFNQHNPDSVYSFNALKSGTKKIETRAASKKYRELQVGDKLVFICGKKKLEKGVRKVTVFTGIDDMLRTYRIKDIMPDRSSKEELKSAYESYSGYKDKIKKFGLVAIELR